MASPDLELQRAIVAWLKSDTSLSALIEGRVYDQPPDEQRLKFPYVTIGEAQDLRDDAVGIDGHEIYLTMHAWSRAVGFPEVKQVASAVVDSLHLSPLSLASFRLISLMHRQTRPFRDADGLTSHAVIEFVALVEKLIA